MAPCVKPSSFLPRTRSKTTFVLVMASYSIAAAGLLRPVADAVGAQRTPLGLLLRQGHPILEVVSLLVLAPIIESLILIGMIELLRWVRGPIWLQVGLPALVSAAMHVPVSHAVVVSPAWFIMAGAYVMWRRASRGSAFIVVASVHALLNLSPAIGTISYAIHHKTPNNAMEPTADRGTFDS